MRCGRRRLLPVRHGNVESLREQLSVGCAVLRTQKIAPVSAPEQDAIEVEIDNGDNAPLVVTSAAVIWEVRRLDFVFEPNDRLALVRGNAGLGSPRYDLALVAGRVLSSPAGAATLGKVAERSAAPPKVPGWFWGFVVAAAALVVVALARTLRADRKSA